jgi:hypothetical protein
MLSYRYEALAARRYREFLWQERKEIWNNKLVSLSMRFLARSVVIMQQAGVIKRRPIERVNVE